MIIGSAIVGLLLGVSFTSFVGRGYLKGKEYHLWRWQADTVLEVAFARLGIGPDPSDTAGLPALESYFKLTSQIRTALQPSDPDVQLVDTLTSERAAYENDVEHLIERWIAEATGSAGLQQSLPLFHGVRFTWPPVAFELTSPPQLLVRSPRKEIRRAGDRLLKNDLTIGDIEKIEDRADNDDKVSIVVAIWRWRLGYHPYRPDNDDTVSIVVAIGGLAAYPAIVRDDRSFDSMLETAAHEWTHHYLAFYPLGQRFGKRPDGTTLNETTADLAGRELANLIRKAHPVELTPGEDGRIPAGPAPTVDFNKEMRAVRLAVDILLADGKVAEAETLMEEKRLYLVANGINLRKLNQAYFAFYGSYAASSAASDPIGPKVDRVWDLTKDVGVFLRFMRQVESTADLDALIAKLETVPKP